MTVMTTISGRTCVLIAAVATAAILSGGCSSVAPRTPISLPPSSADHGGYYLNDGPDSHPPSNLDQVPDAVPRVEPLKSGAMKPYTVLGQTYTPLTELAPYQERGIASWYGRRYNGQKTASGEPYDMYAMTAAHPTLPIPSYARVTNIATGKSVIVRINDRGPFLSDRLIDLSYTAAYKLGVLNGGKALVEVDAILPGQTAIGRSTAALTVQNLRVPPTSVAVSHETAAAPVVMAAPSAEPPVPVSASVIPVAASVAPEVTSVPQPTSTVALTDGPQGIFLQLGAFGSEANADNYLAKLRLQIDSALVLTLKVYQKGDGLFRVRVGPYPTQTDAQQAAERLGQSLGIKAIVVTR